MKGRCISQLFYLHCSALMRSKAVHMGGFGSGKEQVKGAVCMPCQCVPACSGTSVPFSGCQKNQSLNFCFNRSHAYVRHLTPHIAEEK